MAQILSQLYKIVARYNTKCMGACTHDWIILEELSLAYFVTNLTYGLDTSCLFR
jgi:hypothetical protein